MTFLKNNWKNILICLLLVSIGVIYTSSFRCKRSVLEPKKEKIDSLRKENAVNNVIHERIYDSLNKVIKTKELDYLEAEGKIYSITAKYKALINREPSHDTVVQTREVFIGNECLEKMPVLESQITICQSEIVDLKALVKVKTDHNLALQGQFDRSMALNQEQLKEMKKLQRQKRANKAWAVIATGGAAAAVIGLLIVK